jgi:hypothetical protein
MKKPFQKVIVLGIAAFLATNVAVHGTTLYSDASTDTGNSLNFTNGWTLGNEIELGNGINSASITSFSFEIYSTEFAFAGGTNVTMQAFLYANNGTPFNGFSTPGTLLYDSQPFILLTPLIYSIANGLPISDAVTLNFDLSGSPVTVGNDFTLAIEVNGLAGSDSVGLELFGPATVGQNFGDYWLNTGSSWELLTNNVPTDIGAQFTGTVAPEPSTVSLGVIGAMLLMGLTWLRRRDSTNLRKEVSNFLKT